MLEEEESVRISRPAEVAVVLVLGCLAAVRQAHGRGGVAGGLSAVAAQAAAAGAAGWSAVFQWTDKKLA